MGRGGVNCLKNDFRGFSGEESLESRWVIEEKVFERALWRFGVDFAWRRRGKEGNRRTFKRGGELGGSI